MLDLAVRVFSLCLALASAEMLHGIARIHYLIPRVGKQRAKKISIVTGTLLAFCVCYLFIPAMGLASHASALVMGVFLAVFMASFDISVGRMLMKRKWAQIVEDFDPRKGNYLVFGLAALVFIPWIILHIV